MLVDKLLTAVTADQQTRKNSGNLWMSGSGSCQRKQAYRVYGYEAAPLSSRAIMVFRLGDLIEAEVKSIIKKYLGDNFQITFPEEKMEYQVGSLKLTGLVDGIIEHPERMILEVKSIADHSFKSLNREGLSSDYHAQALCYEKALGINKTCFVFYNKNTSHLHEIIHTFDENEWSKVEAKLLNISGSSKDNLPEREYGPDKNGKLPWQCSYCDFNKQCWPDATLTFDNKNKPQLLIEVKNED